jgi:hypothetical protein
VVSESWITCHHFYDRWCCYTFHIHYLFSASQNARDKNLN